MGQCHLSRPIDKPNPSYIIMRFLMMKLKTSYIDSIYKPNKETSNNKFGDTNIKTRLAKNLCWLE